MPLGWERLNVKRTSPNKNIVFMKPRPGPDESTSQDFLERIAAQCLPIMNKHHLAVVSLEEYEPNREFWGRNFNNGEVIQLVLKSASTGRWLPFRFVQMVMMHELAHIHQMNHSKSFWSLRDVYSSEMKALWERGYTGDGLWGKGALLENGAFTHEEFDPEEDLPEHMCGGTYSSRNTRKRKVKPKITYKEQKERRIKRRFGINGETLGADEDTKVKLEKGKRPVGKPRVASSARGRALRAAAALSRFETNKEEPQIKDEELVTDSGTESEMGEEALTKTEPTDAVDINGDPLLDLKGGGMVKVCEDEDNDAADAKGELSDFRDIARTKYPKPTGKYKAVQLPQVPAVSYQPKISKSLAPFAPRAGRAANIKQAQREEVSTADVDNGATACSICSVENEPNASICIVCAHVLQPEFIADSWRCKSLICRDNDYVNSGDVRLCGVCSTRKYSTDDS